MKTKKLNKVGKAATVILFFMLMGFTAPTYGSQILEEANDEAIVILSTVTLQEMQLTRKLIENEGGRIKNIFPPSVFIATIPRNIIDNLKSLNGIKTISYENVNPSDYQEYDYPTSDAIKAWNAISEKRKISKEESMSESLQEQKPFKDELLIPEDLPKTEEEKIQQNQKYLEHWKIKKEELLRQEQEKKLQWQASQGGVYQSQSSLSLGTDSNVSLSTFGRAAGAGFEDTSLYMAGDIAVSVFFNGT